MSFVYRSVGAVATGNGSLNPGAPAGKAVGDLLLLSLVGRDNSQTAPVPGSPGDWTLISPTSPVGWNYLYARIADGTAADTPTGLLYTGTTRSQAQIAAFSGGQWTDLTTIAVNSVSQYLPGTKPSILYDAGLTIAPANCLVIAVGTKNKTATSNGTTINDLSGFTKIDSHVINGTDISQWWGYQIQTTATNIPASQSQTLTGTTETLQYTSLLVALQSSPDLPATTLSPYTYSLGNVTFTTSDTSAKYLFPAMLNYNYSLAGSSSDFELTAGTITYGYAFNAAFLVRLPQNTVFSVDTITYSIAPQSVNLTVFTPTPPAPGTFPNVVGLRLVQAQQALEAAGALVPATLGYFGDWPVTITWVQGITPAGTLLQPGLVVAQNPAPGTAITANAPILLTVTEEPVSVATPPSQANF